MVVAETRALAKDAAELVEVDWEPLPAVTDLRSPRWRTAPRSCTTTSAPTCRASGDSRRATRPPPTRRPSPFFDDPDLVKVKQRYRLRRLIPERHGAARRGRGPERGDGRVHDVHRHPDPPHPAHDAPGHHLRHPRGQAARGGPGRRRRLRLEARRLRRGVDLPRPRAAAQPPRQVDRGALGGLRGHDPRARPLHRHGAGRHPRRRAQGRAREPSGARSAPTTRSSRPASRCSAPGSTAACTTWRATTSSTRTSSRTPRSPTPTAAPGGPRPRTRSSGRWTRWRASWGWTRPSCAARTTSRPRSSPTTRSRAASRSTRADYPGTLDAMIEALDYADVRRQQAERRQSGSTKQIGIGLSTWTEMCGLAPSRVLHALKYIAGGWDAATIEMLPTGTVRVLIGVTPHGQGNGDHVLADRGRPARRGLRRRRGAARRHPGDAAGHGHLRQPLARGRRRRPLQGRREDPRQGPHARCAPAGVQRRTTWSSRAATSRSRAPTARPTSRRSGSAAWTAHDLPDGMEPGLTATHLYDPPNFSWPERRARLRGRGRHRDRLDRHPALRRRRRLRRADQPDGGRGPGARRRGPGHRRGPLRGGDLRRGGQPARRDDDQLHDPRPAGAPVVRAPRHRYAQPHERDGRQGDREAGTIAAPPAVINAVVDALSHLGVTNVERPATPERVWNAIQEAQR